MVFNDIVNWAAFGWFLVCWIGYTYYARKMANTKNCLAALLYQYRMDWMKELLRQKERTQHLILLGRLSETINFLASTTMILLAGSVTVMYSSSRVMNLLDEHSFIVKTTQEQVEFKLLVLVLIFIYAFFRFTWAMRQHTFCSILIGAAPYVENGRDMTEDEMTFAAQLAKISDRAGHEFNYGLRSFYFALALLTWFINPWLLFVGSTVVVGVLYLREFQSKTLSYLVRSRQSFIKIRAKEEMTAALQPKKPVPQPIALSEPGRASMIYNQDQLSQKS